MVAWVGIVAASLLMPGGEPRQVFGEAGLRKVLETSFYADGGTISRSPQAQQGAIIALSMLARIYAMSRMEVTPFVQEVQLGRANVCNPATNAQLECSLLL